MNIQNRQQLLSIIAISAVAFFAGDKLLFSPLVRAYQNRTVRIASLRKQVNDGTALVQRELGIRNRWEQMQNNTLPNDPSVAEQQVLKALDRWSQRSGISVVSIAPQWKRDSDDHMSLECRVEAAGNLDTISRFLFDIEHDPVALKVEAIELSARDNDGRQLALGLQLSGLMLTPQKP